MINRPEFTPYAEAGVLPQAESLGATAFENMATLDLASTLPNKTAYTTNLVGGATTTDHD